MGTATFITTLLIAVRTTFFAGQRVSVTTLVSVPWWARTGGALGAVYVLATVLVADKVGAVVFMGVTVTVAILTSLVMDQFGLLGFDVHKAGLARHAGAVLMFGGLGLIAKF